MKRGAFRRLPGQDDPVQSFGGKVVDLSGRVATIPSDAIAGMERSHMGERRIVIAGEFEPTLDVFSAHAAAEAHQVCIRPKETTLRLGPLGVVKLWKVQFVGKARVFRKPDGSVDLRGLETLRRMRAPIGTRIGWYVIGAPIFNTRMLWTWLRGQLVTQGAIITK